MTPAQDSKGRYIDPRIGDVPDGESLQDQVDAVEDDVAALTAADVAANSENYAGTDVAAVLEEIHGRLDALENP